MYSIIEIQTHYRTELIDITILISNILKKNKNKSGCVIIYVPHTTAAVTINENYDRSVTNDITNTLNNLFPSVSNYSHIEGNADAHIKTALIGSSRSVFFDNKKLVLGAWQGIFFCEFDGPRKRKILVKIIPDL